MGLARRVAAMDGRVKMGVALALGPLAWRAGPIGTGVFLAAFVGLCLALSSRMPVGRATLRANAVFVIFWSALKFGFDLWGGQAPSWALAGDAGLLGAKLLALILLGLSLSAAASARELGMAFSWALRPALGKRAWTAALALALMAHSLPLCWEVMAKVRRSVVMRCQGMGFWQTAVLYPSAGLRAISQKTWSWTLAIAARGLDRPEAWRGEFPRDPMGLLWGGVVVAAAAAASMV